MTRYTGPRCRLVRRAGIPLGLKVRDERVKCKFETPPGGHRRRRLTDYGVRLREVQRTKWYYGVLDRQFRRAYREAERLPGDTGFHLLQRMERRVDNVVCHLRFALTRPQARQLVAHGHIHVNGRRVDRPSYLVGQGDFVEPHPRERSRMIVRQAMKEAKDRPVPAWLNLDEQALRGTVLREPLQEDLPAIFDARLIVEYMAR